MDARLLLALVASVAVVAAWPPMPIAYRAPMFMSYMRPRRAPAGPGAPAFPSRTLTFSGYFSGAGAPQAGAGDPYAFSWGPAVRSAHAEEAPPPGPPVSEPQEPQQGDAADAPPDNPPVVDVPYEEGEGGFETRAKPGPAKNKPQRPSYPVPEGGNHEPPQHPQHPQQPQDSGDDRGGYGTINAYFPFMFSGGWPSGGGGGSGAPGPRGYGAPPPPPPPNSSPSAGPQEGSHGGNWSPSNSGTGSRSSPYYPVAIANSFSTGRNAMASSTATAYGGPPQ